MDRRKYTNDNFKEALLNYGFIYISGEYINANIIYPSNYIRGDYSPVIQYDLNDNYIAEYPSIAEAKRQTGIKYISETLCNGKHFCFEYNWYYKKK